MLSNKYLGSTGQCEIIQIIFWDMQMYDHFCKRRETSLDSTCADLIRQVPLQQMVADNFTYSLRHCPSHTSIKWSKESHSKNEINKLLSKLSFKLNKITTKIMQWNICVADIAYSCIQQKIGGRHVRGYIYVFHWFILSHNYIFFFCIILYSSV